jgi:hypothetical protein
MARIKLSPLLTEVRGSVGRSTFQRSQGGVSLRLKPLPSKKYSSSLQISKIIVSQVIAAWQGLSDAQRLLWSQYAAFSPIPMKGDHSRTLSGYNHFVKYNLIRCQSGLDILEDCIFLSPDMLTIDPIIQKFPDKFVTVGEGTNSIAWSNNGLTWTGLGTGIFSGYGHGVCWNGSKFVAVGSGTNSIAWSNDGLTWTGLGTGIFSTNGFGVCWNGSKFIAVGAGTNSIAWSSDGITWTGLGTAIFSTYGFGVCWNGSKFIAVGAGTNSIAWSNDGLTWTGLGTGIFSTSGRNVCWNGSKFIAVGAGTNSIAWSSDGITWTGLGTAIFSTYGLGVCWNGSKFIAVGSGTNTIAWSNDGLTWTGLGTGIFSTNGNSVCWNGSKFIAVGSGTNTIAWSNDGLTWTGLGTGIFSTNGFSVCSNRSPNLYPQLYGGRFQLLFNCDLQASNQFAIVKLSLPQRVSQNFRLNTCRVTLLDYYDTDPFDITDEYIAVFAKWLEVGDFINCEITLFSTETGKTFHPLSYQLTVELI